MLPSAKNYLIQAGYSSQAAAFFLIGLFLAGVVGIQIISGFIHHYMPSHVVDCAHTHGIDGKDSNGHGEEGPEDSFKKVTENDDTENTPLLAERRLKRPSMSHVTFSEDLGQPANAREPRNTATPRRPLLREQLTRPITFLVGGSKAACDESGPCYGFSQACGQECKKTAGRKGSKDLTRVPEPSQGEVRQPVLPRHQSIAVQLETQEPGPDGEVPSQTVPSTERYTPNPNQSLPSHSCSCQPSPQIADEEQDHYHSPPRPLSSSSSSIHKQLEASQGTQHHHHVPQNAFLSIGLQTSLAIALHKIPEGIITYATNHVNPNLGLTIFLAIAIHNVTEGFAMALPLYLALNSRLKAMLWSSLLGGISQPAGAGIAALWIWFSGDGYPADGGPETSESSYAIYGGMFAATAGVMTSVALQLFSEGLSLMHGRAVCIGFAVAGMGILGVSNALTA